MKKILLVEDEEQLRELFAIKLGREGFQVIEASNGKEALDQLSKTKPDIIISDITMPVMDGRQLFDEVHKLGPDFAAIPFIFLTAHRAVSQQIEGLKQGAAAYITKPVKFEMLIASVNSILNFQERQSQLVEDQIKNIVREKLEKYGASLSEDFDVSGLVDEYHKVILESENPAFDASLIESLHLRIRSLADVNKLCGCFANFMEDREAFTIGFVELLVNAIEHGKLGIGYDLKTKLIDSGRLHDEIEERCAALPDKFVDIFVERIDGYLKFRIEDHGEGFDHKPFLAFDPENRASTHGRGLAISKSVAFPDLTYSDGGSIVHFSAKTLDS